MKPLKYQSELMKVTNIKTGKTTYYVSKCDVMQRISKVDFDQRYDIADGFSCCHQVKTTKHVRQYITAVYEG